MPIPLRQRAGPRRRGALRRATLVAVVLGTTVACREASAPTEIGPSLVPGGNAVFTVTPTALQFPVPPRPPAELTVTIQFPGDITASSSSTSCATVSPLSAPATKLPGQMVYTARFAVTPVAVGTCTVTLTDKKGRQLEVPVDVIPTQVDLRGETVAAGFAFSCGLTSAGEAYCWGDNTHGQLGDGSTTDSNTPVAVLGPGGNPALTFASLTAGGFHACGLTSAGQAYCWGHNGNGELGDGSALPASTTPVAVGGGVTFTRLTGGLLHTCGLGTDGAAYCWGRNTSGQLGIRFSLSESTPTPVSGGLLFASLAAGDLHTCGLTGNGTAYCWGNNDSGQLGDASFAEQFGPVAVLGPGAGSPVRFTSLAAGEAHTCGTTSGGSLYCWGDNQFGQLGDGSTTDRPLPTLVSGGVGLASVAAGGAHSCGLTSAGLAYCWGNNASGEVGDGTTVDRAVPTAVSGPGGGAALTFATLSAGAAHTCAVATDGAGYCWGINVEGQLGIGSGGGGTGIGQVSVPTAIVGPAGGSALSFKQP